MLQTIRSKATSFVVKILFGLLIVTFGLWGIGDIFRDRGTDTTVATVGGRTITIDAVNKAVQTEMERLRGLFGGSIDAAQAKELGVVDQALQGIINNDLVELEIARMGLAIGDESVRDAILNTSGFHNQAGAFDRNIYAQALALNHLSEPEFEAMERGDLLRTQLQHALTDGLTAPKELVDVLYRARAERRVADTVILPASAVGTIAPPTEDEIAQYYKAHEDRFRTAERRSFKLATVRLDDIAAGITVTEDQLKQEFAARQDEFHTPEQRQLEQMLFPDEATATAAAAQLAGGAAFAQVAKDVAKTDDPAALELGWMTRQDLPPELADPAFALAANGNTAPIKSTFGWHILHLVAVKPEHDQTIDEVKDKLAKEVARDAAGDRIADLANQIDDALAGGATFEDVVKKFNLKTVSAADIDAAGNGVDGKPVELPQPRETILKAVFNTENGKTSALTEMGEDGYFIVAVENVAPATTRPLADVHDQAAGLVEDETRQAALQKLADQIVTEVNAGRSLKDLAGERHLTLATTPAVSRTSKEATVAPTLVAKLFDIKQGAAVTDTNASGTMVAQLQSIEPADPAKDPEAVQQLSQALAGALQTDILTEFDEALRRVFPVSVDRTSLDRLM
jgi:peptidyl-prolyl cis-trans isomerase D